jgi:hypothetical protein
VSRNVEELGTRDPAQKRQQAREDPAAESVRRPPPVFRVDEDPLVSHAADCCADCSAVTSSEASSAVDVELRFSPH